MPTHAYTRDETTKHGSAQHLSEVPTHAYTRDETARSQLDSFKSFR